MDACLFANFASPTLAGVQRPTQTTKCTPTTTTRLPTARATGLTRDSSRRHSVVTGPAPRGGERPLYRTAEGRRGRRRSGSSRSRRSGSCGSGSGARDVHALVAAVAEGAVLAVACTSSRGGGVNGGRGGRGAAMPCYGGITGDRALRHWHAPHWQSHRSFASAASTTKGVKEVPCAAL